MAGSPYSVEFNAVQAHGRASARSNSTAGSPRSIECNTVRAPGQAPARSNSMAGGPYSVEFNAVQAHGQAPTRPKSMAGSPNSIEFNAVWAHGQVPARSNSMAGHPPGPIPQHTASRSTLAGQGPVRRRPHLSQSRMPESPRAEGQASLSPRSSVHLRGQGWSCPNSNLGVWNTSQVSAPLFRTHPTSRILFSQPSKVSQGDAQS